MPFTVNKNNLTVYIYNVVEDEWSFIDSLAGRHEQNRYIDDCENTSDCYFLGAGRESDLVYVSPTKIDQQFQDYAKKIIGYKNVKVIVPKVSSHLICDDLIKDSKTLNDLINLMRDYKQVTLLSYSGSPQLYALKNVLIESGVNVQTPELPEPQNAWTINFFGSKSGIRQLAQQSVAEEPDFDIPNGLICVGRNDAAKIAADWYIKNKGVVIKTNKGSGGAGVLIFRENDLPFDYSACERGILDKMNGDKYWDYYPIIVEDLINANLSLPSSLPNVEYQISRNGQISLSYVCATRVTPEGVYYGLDIGSDLLNDRIVARIVDTGYYIGEKFSKAGYRGIYDVDMMMAKNGDIYVNESNTRNTGGTDIFRIAKKLLGPDFADNYYTITRSKYELTSTKNWNFTNITSILEPLLYNSKTKIGLIINSSRYLSENRLIYTIFGKNKKQAYAIETKMFNLLNN